MGGKQHDAHNLVASVGVLVQLASTLRGGAELVAKAQLLEAILQSHQISGELWKEEEDCPDMWGAVCFSPHHLSLGGRPGIKAEI